MAHQDKARSGAWQKARAWAPKVVLGLALAGAPCSLATAADAPAKPAPQPITTANPAIDVGDLKLLLEPLTRAELEVEASGWFALLRKKVLEVSEAELAVRRKNREISALAKVKAAAETVAAASTEVKDKAATASAAGEKDKAAATKKLEEANAALAKSVADTKKTEAAASAPPAEAAPAEGAVPAAGDQEVMNKAVASAQKKAEVTGDSSAVADKVVAASKDQSALSEVKDLADKAPAAAAKTGGAVAPDAAATSQKAETLVAKAKEAAAAKSDVKVQLIDYSTQLNSERTAITDRLKMVLDELELKGGKAEDIRQYIAAVGGLKIDVSDQTATIARVKSWLLADEGGLRWARNIGIFLAYVIASIIIAWIVRGVLDRAMRVAGVTSELLQSFVVGMSGRVVVFIGILAGLSALEVNLAPLLAVIGAAGFVVAFALQGTLSNLASGLLIMVNKPFDRGDEVEVAGGIKGRIKEVTMFQTVVLTEEGTIKIVPNNSIWGGVIVNYTMGTVTNADKADGEGTDPSGSAPAAA